MVVEHLVRDVKDTTVVTLSQRITSQLMELPYELQELVRTNLGKVSTVACDIARVGPAVVFNMDFDIVCGINPADVEHHAIPCNE